MRIIWPVSAPISRLRPPQPRALPPLPPLPKLGPSMPADAMARLNRLMALAPRWRPADPWPFTNHRTMAQVMADERAAAGGDAA